MPRLPFSPRRCGFVEDTSHVWRRPRVADKKARPTGAPLSRSPAHRRGARPKGAGKARRERQGPPSLTSAPQARGARGHRAVGAAAEGREPAAAEHLKRAAARNRQDRKRMESNGSEDNTEGRGSAGQSVRSVRAGEGMRGTAVGGQRPPQRSGGGRVTNSVSERSARGASKAQGEARAMEPRRSTRTAGTPWGWRSLLLMVPCRYDERHPTECLQVRTIRRGVDVKPSNQRGVTEERSIDLKLSCPCSFVLTTPWKW